MDNKIAAPKEILAIEYKKEPGVEEECPPSPPPPEPVKVEEPVAQPPDLLVISQPLFLLIWMWYFFSREDSECFSVLL